MSFAFATLAATALIAAGPAPPGYVAPCPSGVSGGLPSDYERSSLLAGPLALYPVRGDYPRYPARFIVSVRESYRRSLRSFDGRRLTRRERREQRRLRAAVRRASAHRYAAFEAVAAVRNGGTVTLAVAPEDRDHVAFLFDAHAFSHADEGYAIADGTAAVTLHGCTAPYTQYQGGFVADGPRCATLEAWIDGAVTPERRVVSFGAGHCGSPEQTRPGGPPPPKLALGPRPAVVARGCRRARLSWCPSRWPVRPGSHPQGGRDFARGGAHLLSFSDPAVEGEGGHLLIGERPAPYDLRGTAGAAFARRGRDPLELPSARVLRRARIRGHAALVLAAPPFPRGGIHGNHVIVVWNEHGRGRVVSLHFRDQLDPGRYDGADRIRVALAVAAS